MKKGRIGGSGRSRGFVVDLIGNRIGPWWPVEESVEQREIGTLDKRKAQVFAQPVVDLLRKVEVSIRG